MAEKQEQWHGIFPYLVSPIDEATGRVREDVLRRLINHLLERGVHGFSPLGSTGEFAYLSGEQRADIARIVVEETAGRVPVVPGVASSSTADAVAQAQRCLELGANGIVLILQTFFPLKRSAIERYFIDVAEAISCPVVVYTNPQLLGADVTPEIVAALSHVPNIQYVKDASSNTGRILTILNRVGDRMQVFSASAHVPVLVFLLGGIGWMAGPACLIPRECVALYQLAQQHKWDEAMILQRTLWKLNVLFSKYSLAGCVKTGLELQGFAVGPPIAPQESLSGPAVEEIRDVLEEISALELASVTAVE